MSLSYMQLVGPPPVDSLRSFKAWFLLLMELRIAAAPITRATTYYFDNVAGDDTTGEGTLAAPWKTIAKAQAVHDDPGDGSDPLITHGGSDFALLFKRGVEWNETTGLGITKDYVTIGAYGTGAKPNFSTFGTKLASGGAAWANVSGDNYKTTGVTACASVRITGDLDTVLIRMADSAGVTSTPGSWWRNSGTNELHINVGDGLDPDDYDIEYCPVVQDSGIEWLGDFGRIDSIRTDGWGINPSPGTEQHWGIKIGCKGTDACVVTNCEAYYTSLHSMGLYGGDAPDPAGGIAVFVDCKGGFCNYDASSITVFVAYTNKGGQECLMHNCEATCGRLPTAASSIPNGKPMYSHTTSSTYKVGLVINWGMKIKGGLYGCSRNTDFHPDCVPACTASNRAPCRAFIVDEVLDADRNGEFAIAANNVININPVYNIKSGAWATQTLYVGQANGVCVNGRITVDLEATTTRNSFFNAAAVQNSCGLHHNHFHIIGNGTQGFAIDADAHNNTGTSGAAVTATNNILTGTNMGTGTLYFGLSNTGAIQHHNAFYGVSGKADAVRGYSNDAYAIEPPDMPVLDEIPSAYRALYRAGSNGQTWIDVDAEWRERDVNRPTIGPVENARDFDYRKGVFRHRRM